MKYLLITLAVLAAAWVYCALRDTWAAQDARPIWGWLFVIVGCVTGITACHNSDSHQAHLAERARIEQMEKQPRVIREVDGCKVYAFKSGDHWHYFTRCPDSVTSTDTGHTVRRGKSSRTEYSTIEVRP